MARSGKTAKTNEPEAFDFSLGTKRDIQAHKREIVLAHSETLLYEFERMRDAIEWNMLRQATTEDQVNAALSRVDEFDRNRLPSPTAILATVQDPKYPKLRPIPFLAKSCALAIQANPKSSDLYSPRYSRDICFEEKKRRGPIPNPSTGFEYWRGQADLGLPVPKKFLRRINREEKKMEIHPARSVATESLTYTDIPEKIGGMRKRRTTVWLPERIIEQLKRLSSTTGAPMAELFRRAVEAYLKDS